MSQARSVNKGNLSKTLILGVQHVFAMFGATVLVPALTGLSPSVALLCAGLGTLLYHLITKGKVPTFLGSSFAFIAAIQLAAQNASDGAAIGSEAYTAALPYATGGIVIAGAVYVVMSFIVKLVGTKKFLKLFPPIVTGPMIIIIGLMLAPTAISNITGGGALTGAPLLTNWLVALITIAVIVCVSLFTKGFFKLVPILFGIVGGYIAALCFGLVDFTAVNQVPFFDLPKVFLPKFSWNAILLIAPIAIVTFVEHIGDMTASSAVVGKNFMEDPGLPSTLLGDGLATMLAGVLGGPANTTYSENTGVLAATRNYNPATLRIAAIIAILLSFLGKFGAALQTLPGAVMGGVSIILFGMIAAVGLRTLVENHVDFKHTRNLIIAAVMLVLGLGGATLQFSETVSISGTALAAVMGIVLNLVLPDKIDKHLEEDENAEDAKDAVA